jgi:AAA family ATPase
MLEAIGGGGSTFEVTPRHKGQKCQRRHFRVDDITPNDGSLTPAPYTFDYESKVVFSDPPAPSGSAAASGPAKLTFNFDGLIGFDQALAILVYRLNKANANWPWPAGYPFPRLRPILIRGALQNGKTTVLRNIRNAPWGKVLSINFHHMSAVPGKAAANVSKIFAEAAKSRPALIIFDNLEIIAPKSESFGFAEDLADELRYPNHGGIQVVAAVTRLNDLHEKVARCFSSPVELPTPNAHSRFELLQHFAGYDNPEMMRKVAQKTHGFVAHDLDALCEAALEAAYFNTAKEIGSKHATEEGTTPARDHEQKEIGSGGGISITEEAFELAIRNVSPSARGEAFVDIPKVYWSDIGGSEAVKEELGAVVDFFFGEDRITDTNFGVKPTQGILLYGPPGCAKTLTAKALATESGFGFLAVKGPELVSKFVGDTEHNIREVFRKAKAAAPCFIFFDEIDSITAPRGDIGAHESVNTVTTLLNELDGIEELKQVLVLAATNRPERVDKALLRPGRLGTHIYLGPPNLQARKHILDINTRNRRLSPDVDIAEMAPRLERYSGADIAELCRRAAMLAANDCKKGISDTLLQIHLDAAFERVRPSISKEEIRQSERWSVDGDKF